MKKNHAKKVFFVSIIFTLITALAVGLLFWLIEKKNSETSLLMTEISEQDTRKEEIRNLARENETLKEDINKLTEIFIGSDQEQVVKFIEQVEVVAKVSKIELDIKEVKVVPIEDPKLTKEFESVDLKLETQGSWSEIFHFLNLLENLPRHIVFKKMSLSFVPASDNEGFSGWEGLFDFSVTKLK